MKIHMDIPYHRSIFENTLYSCICLLACIADWTMDIWKEFCLTTSIKGIPRAVKSRSLPMRVLWTVCVVGFLGLAFIQSYMLTNSYLNFDVTTTLSNYRTNPFTDFNDMRPDISLCNTNPFGSNASLVRDIPNLQEFYELVVNVTSCETCSSSETGDLEQLRQTLLSAWAYAFYIGPDNVKRIGHSLESLLADCHLIVMEGRVLKQISCFPRTEVVYHQDLHFYNCYTLRLPTVSPKSYLYVGISLVLHLDNFFEDYLIYLDKNNVRNRMNGVQISLHTANTPRSVGFDSLFLPPGFLSDIKVLNEKRLREKHPYGSCVNYTENRFYDNGAYSVDHCYSSCVQTRVAESCDCIDFNPYMDANTTYTNYTKCFDLNRARGDVLQTWKCVAHERHAAMIPCSAQCTLACTEISYQTKVGAFGSSWISWNCACTRHILLYIEREMPNKIKITWLNLMCPNCTCT